MSLLYNTFSMVGVTPTPNVYKINPSLALICPFVYLFNTPLQLISTSPPTTHLHLPPLTPPQPISISHLPSAPSFTQFTSLAYLPAPYPCHAPPSPTHSPAPPFSITSSSTKPQCQLMYVLGPKIHTPLPPTRPSLPPPIPSLSHPLTCPSLDNLLCHAPSLVCCSNRSCGRHCWYQTSPCSPRALRYENTSWNTKRSKVHIHHYFKISSWNTVLTRY